MEKVWNYGTKLSAIKKKNINCFECTLKNFKSSFSKRLHIEQNIFEKYKFIDEFFFYKLNLQ